MKSLKNHLLVASPTLLDPNFAKTVVLIIEHNDDGALGLILNRPTNVKLFQAWKQLKDEPHHANDLLHLGGPCEGPLMVLHGIGALAENELQDGVYFSVKPENITQLVNLADAEMRFFVGFAGWAAGQLENELEELSWEITPASAEHVFSADEELWLRTCKHIANTRLVRDLGIKHVPADPRLN